MEIEKVYFNSMDDINLFGLLHKGTSKSKKVVLSVHGMTSNCLKMRENIFAEEYCEKGIDYFCFNNIGGDIKRYY